LSLVLTALSGLMVVRTLESAFTEMAGLLVVLGHWLTKEEEGWELIIAGGPGNWCLARVSDSKRRRRNRRAWSFLLSLVLTALLMVVRTLESAFTEMAGLLVVLGHWLTKEDEGWELIIASGPGNWGLARVSYSRRRRGDRRTWRFLLFFVLIALLMVVRTLNSAFTEMAGLLVVLGRWLAKEEEGWELIIAGGPGNWCLARVSYSRRRRRRGNRRAWSFLLFLVLIALLMVVLTVKSAFTGMAGPPVVLGHWLTKEEKGWKLIIVDGHGNWGLARVSDSRRRRRKRRAWIISYCCWSSLPFKWLF
jgi:predicted anti-sigma-YlaC factor YlaD